MQNTDIKIHEFDLFKAYPNIVHGIFSRAENSSTESSSSLSSESNTFDKQLVMKNNQRRIEKKMGTKPFVFLNQVHKTGIAVLKKEETDLSERFLSGIETYTADAIITDMKEVFIVIQVADCQAVMLFDPVKKVIANIHSGWKGSVQNIIGKCVDKMSLDFGCRPDHILAGISASLGPCCSEFINYRKEIPENLWHYKIDGKDYFDFWKLSCDQLMEKGVRKEGIENMETCTKCNTDQFYSFRGEKAVNRFACVICMQ